MKTRFTVEGTGTFPFDMLRQDQCWPADERESELLAGIDPRQIRLEKSDDAAPNVARWATCGWRVVTLTLFRGGKFKVGV